MYSCTSENRSPRISPPDSYTAPTAATPGSVPPFGRPILPFPLYVDETTLANERIGISESTEKIEHLDFAIEALAPRFGKLLWVPGNHDLWVTPNGDSGLRGEERYLQLVELCRSFDTLTPEDPYATWPGDGPPTVIAPLLRNVRPILRMVVGAPQARRTCISCMSFVTILLPQRSVSADAGAVARMSNADKRVSLCMTMDLLSGFPKPTT